MRSTNRFIPRATSNHSCGGQVELGVSARLATAALPSKLACAYLAAVVSFATCAPRECPACGDAEKCAEALKAAQERTAKFESSIKSLEATVKDLKTTADVQWASAQILLKADPTSEEGAQWLAELIRDHPTDPRLRLAKKQLSAVSKAKQEAAEVAKLASIRAADIAAEPSLFRRKTFERRMCCRNPMGGSVLCYWAFGEDGSVDYGTSEQIYLHLRPGQGKQILAGRLLGDCGHLV
jgi:hypothetical protein